MLPSKRKSTGFSTKDLEPWTSAMKRPYLVNLDDDDGMTFASFLLAHMAWPSDEARCGALFLSLCAFLIRERCEADADWAQQPQWIVPQHAALSDSQINHGLRGYKLRMEHRIAAGRMAMAFFREVWEGRPPPLPPGIKRLSENEVAAMGQDDLGMSDVGNVTTRVLRPSRPVVHLCSALTLLLSQEVAAGRSWLSLTDAFSDRRFLELLLTRARFFEALLPWVGLNVDPSTVHRFHLAPAADHTQI